MSKDIPHNSVSALGSVAMPVAQSIRDSLEQLSTTERRIARVLLADYPSAGLGSVQFLAEQAEVSAPSVIRFVRRLGFEGFPDFQQSLREELSKRSHWQLRTLGGKNVADITSKAVNVSLESIMGALNYSLDNIPEYDLKRAFELLSSVDLRVMMGGGYLSHSLAEYFSRNLQQIRPNVSLLPEAPTQRLPIQLDAGKKDLFVIFDFRCYQQDVIEFCKKVKKQGATLLLVTDIRMSPIARCADVVLPVIAELDWPHFSYSGAVVIVELLSAMVMEQLGEESIARRRHWGLDFEVLK